MLDDDSLELKSAQVNSCAGGPSHSVWFGISCDRNGGRVRQLRGADIVEARFVEDVEFVNEPPVC